MRRLATEYELTYRREIREPVREDAPFSHERREWPDLDVGFETRTTVLTPFQHILNLVDARHFATIDNLRAVAILMRKRRILVGGFASARTLVESASIIYWLLDPQIDGRTRVARAYNDRLASLSGAHSYFRKKAPDTDHFLKLRFDDSVKQARQVGFHIREPRNGARWWDRRVSLPDSHRDRRMTALVDDLVGAGSYSMLSGYAHAEEWALTNAVNIAAGWSRGPDGRDMAQLGIAESDYLDLALLASDGFVKAVDRHVNYLGWPADHWESTKNRNVGRLVDALARDTYGARRGKIVLRM